MIERNEELLMLLEDAHGLASEQQKATKSNNDDTRFIGAALEIVKMRIKYLKVEAAKKATKPKAPEAPAKDANDAKGDEGGEDKTNAPGKGDAPLGATEGGAGSL